MATAALRRAMTALTRPSDPTDADLLRQFAENRSETAFAALVRRHGPLVFGVCRRVVPDRHMVDDAFQAAFVVLARRAGGIDPTRPLGPWLYGVAHRVALRARTMLGKRRKRETLAAAVPDTPRYSPAVDDSAAVLDEEIAKLPDATRDAVILCELQGLSRREAAKRLGIAEGTLSSRLAAARKVLAAKLQSRGVVLSAALTGATVVSPQLASAAVAAGTSISLNSVVASLADGASAMTLLNKLKLTGVAVLFMLLSAGGVGPWGANESSAAPVPKQKPEGELLWVLNDITFELKAYSPDGKLVKEFKLPEGNRYLGITPDGQKIAFAGKKGKVADPKETNGLTVHLRDIGTGTEGTDTGLDYREGDIFTWSPDATRVVHSRTADLSNPFAERTYALYDLDSRKSTELKLPHKHHVRQWASDGTWLLVCSDPSPRISWTRWSKYTLSDSKLTPIATDFPSYSADVSPDGRSLIGYAQRVVKEEGEPRHDHRLVRVEIASGTETTLSEFTEPTGYGYGWTYWSPDGSRLAFWCSVPNKAGDSQDMQLSVCDAETGERKTIVTLPYNPWVLQGWYPAARKIKAPVPKEKDRGLIWLHDSKTGEVVGYAPDGTEAERGKLPRDQSFLGVTPDGTRILYEANGTYHLRPFGENTAGTDLGVRYNRYDRIEAWHPDGTQFLKSQHEQPGRMVGVRFPDVNYEIVDVTNNTSIPFRAPENTYTLGWTPDGKQFVGKTVAMGLESPRGLCLFPLPDKNTPDRPKRTPLTLNDHASPLTFAPSTDGKTQLVGGWKLGPGESLYHAAYRLNPTDATLTELMHEDGQNQTQVAPSPDGSRMAVLWEYTAKADYAVEQVRLTVANADGTARTTVTLRDKMTKVDRDRLHLLGWFSSSKIKAPVPKAKADDEVLLISSSHGRSPFLIVSPDGKSQEKLSVPAGVEPRTVRVSPDGRWAAYGEILAKGGAAAQGYHPCRVRVIDLHSPEVEPKTLLDETYGEALTWSADGKAVIVSRFAPEQIAGIRGQKNGFIPMKTTRVTLADGKETSVELPEGHRALAVSPDMQTWLTHTIDATRTTNESFVVTLKNGKVDKKAPVGKSQLATQISADGKRALCGTGSVDPGQSQLASVDLATMKLTELKLPDGVNTEWIGFARWSADGQRLAFAWGELVRDRNGKPVEVFRVTVCNADGSKPVTVAELEPGAFVKGIDWLPAKPAVGKEGDPKAKPPVREPIKAPVPREKADDGLIWTHNTKTNTLTAYTPGGKETKTVQLPDGLRFAGFMPDGTRMMFAGKGGKVSTDGDGLTLHVGPIDDSGTGTDTGLGWMLNDQFIWSPDGLQVVRTRLVEPAVDIGGKMVGPEFHHVVFDLGTKKESQLALVADHQLTQWSADGKTYRVLHHNLGRDPTLPNYRWLTTTVGGKPDLKPICDTHSFAWMEPDAGGTKFLGVGWQHPTPGNATTQSLFDVSGGKATEVVSVTGVAFAVARRSPDGKRVVCAKYEHSPQTSAANTVLVLFDADGKNEEKLLTIPKDGQQTQLLGWFPVQPTAVKKDDPKAKPPADSGLVWTYSSANRELIGYTPDGKKAKEITVEESQLLLALTPDGKQMLYTTKKGITEEQTLHLRAIDGTDEGVDLGVPYQLARGSFYFTADGKKVACTRAKAGVGAGRWEHVVTDLTTKKEQVLKGPEDAHVVGVSPDGSWALILEQPIPGGVIGPGAPPAKANLAKLHKVPLNGDKPAVLAERAEFRYAAVSPDGKTVLADGLAENGVLRGVSCAVLRIDVATGKIIEVAAHALQIDTAVGWSPDGSQIAYMWLELVAVPNKRGTYRPTMSRLVVCDPDGKNDTTWDVHNYAAPESKGATKLLGWLPAPPPAKKAKPPVKEPIKAPVPKELADAGLVWTYDWSTGVLTAFTPDGKRVHKHTLKDGRSLLGLTPDGQQILYAGKNGKLPDDPTKPGDGLTLHLRPIGEDGTGTDLGIPCDWSKETFRFTADGKKIIRSQFVRPRTQSLWDVATRKETVVDTRDGVEIVDLAPDGTWVLTIRSIGGKAVGVLEKVPLNGTATVDLTERERLHSARVSPDGKKILFSGVADVGGNTRHDLAVLALDVASGKIAQLATHTMQSDTRVTWSPDGRRIAYQWLATKPMPGYPRYSVGDKSLMVVCDADGTNSTTWDIYEYDANSKGSPWILGWFPTLLPAKKDVPKATPLVKEPIKAPVPKAKPPQPEKLDRPPPAPDELRKELAGWDEKYRHGSEEQFAELEKRAAELAKEYDTDYNQARVWYAVAYIAGQSDIGKHADRVRKYAEKCLKVSRDPLDRSRLYGYLASCEELAGGEFAVRRRKAADWLLKGYLELLVQELPAQKPELPGVMKFRIAGEGPDAAQAWAKHAAQMAAREQAEWVSEQVGRRDNLVLCFRNLYEPHPKAHGHGPDGPAELRKFAEVVLPTTTDVDTLMERVLPQAKKPNEPKAKPPGG